MITKFEQAIATILSEAILTRDGTPSLDFKEQKNKILDGLLTECMSKDNNNLGYELVKEVIEKILFSDLKERIDRI